MRFEVGVDIGGTFTDVVCRAASGEKKLVKIPTTRNGTDRGPRSATGKRRFCQHPLQINDGDWIIRLSQGPKTDLLARCRSAR